MEYVQDFVAAMLLIVSRVEALRRTRSRSASAVEVQGPEPIFSINRTIVSQSQTYEYLERLIRDYK